MTSVPATSTTTTYLLIDGENIDMTLGNHILGRRPEPEERPRWDRVLQFARQVYGNPVKSFFFLNASSGSMPISFVQALVAIGLRPFPLAGQSHEKVVDIGISRTLRAIAERGGDVLLATHDGDFLPEVQELVARQRRVGILAFTELANVCYSELGSGVSMFDLEDDVGCFDMRLPRLRIIRLEDFDPAAYL